MWKAVLKIKSVTEGLHMHTRSVWEYVVLNMYKTHAVSQNLFFYGPYCALLLCG